MAAMIDPARVMVADQPVLPGMERLRLQPPAPPLPPRKIIQISATALNSEGASSLRVLALCNDGTVWGFGNPDSGWLQFPAIPPNN